jgi:FlaG/FlaF family flagellin (archaellin)
LRSGRRQGRARQEEAVSPVIGVMLMITVTILIAATLSAFVGGATGDLKKCPQATMIVRSGGEGTGFSIVFEQHGGDLLRTEDLEIVTWAKDPDGKMVKHIQSPDSARSPGITPPTRVPYVYESQSGITESLEFGTAVWKPGTTAGTGTRAATAGFLGVSETELDDMIATHSQVEVDIVHRPSGSIVLKTEFALGG